MVTKRIIPCLDVRNGRVVKGVNFLDVQDVSDPVRLADYYSRSGADELVFYDITASVEGRKLFTDILTDVASTIFIPLTVGGGISRLEMCIRDRDIGVDQRPGHIAAGPLSRVLIDIDPAAVQPLPEDGLILAPQGGHGPIDGLPGVGIGDFGVHPGDHGSVHIVEVQLLQAQKLFPQADIAVHLVQVGPDGGDAVSYTHLHRSAAPGAVCPQAGGF